MESRMDKYHDVDIDEFQRSKKNADLYKEVYGNYGDFEDLPISENTNEIDIENFKSLVGSRSLKRKEYVEREIELLDDEDIEKPKENKVYDINALLEMAKEENAKIKKEVPINRNIPNYLANLESDKNTKDIILKYDGDIDDDLPIVKTTTFSTTSVDVNADEQRSSDLSLDILSDLKPNGDTLVSEPINEEVEHEELLQEEKEFFDEKSNFSKDDFNDEDDEIFYEKKDHLFLKVILLIAGIASVITAGFFIIKEYTNIF